MLNLLKPWIVPSDNDALVSEFLREVRPDGILYQIKIVALAMRCDCDDVLFSIDDGTGRVAVVHLTWSGKQDSNKGWPETIIFESYQSWIEMCMIPDHDEYNL